MPVVDKEHDAHGGGQRMRGARITLKKTHTLLPPLVEAYSRT